MKPKELVALILPILLLLSGCSKNQVPKNFSSGDTLQIVVEDSSENAKKISARTNENGIVCVLFGYGFNGDEFKNEALAAIEEKFGFAENGGIVLPLIFPDDLHGRISYLREVAEKNFIRAFVLLGAPNDTHYTLAKILDEWNSEVPFGIFSLFPQDDILGQEGTCDFVLDYKPSAEIEFDELQTKEDKDILRILISVIDYASILPGSIRSSGELHAHVQSILGRRKVVRYVDNETGIQAENHFVIEPAVKN